VVAGLAGTGVGAHNTGSATPWAITLDFLEVSIVGDKMDTAPAAAPILSMSLLLISDSFFSLCFFSIALFLGIRISFHPHRGGRF
jgi:hypothetical protein